MRRRFLLATTLLLATTQTVRAQSSEPPDDTDAPPAPRRITVTTQQMEAAVAQRFPLRYPVAGMADLDLQTPALQLLPEQNRIAAEMALQVAGPALQRSYQGTFAVDFALRYEASDHSIRATKLRLRSLQIPGLSANAVALLNGYAPLLAQRSMLEVVVYRLQPKDLALADGLGLQPGAITVTDTGVRVELVHKPD